MLDARRLDALKTVIEQGSFSAAADRLNFTQPAISRQIAALERATGARLPARDARGIYSHRPASCCSSTPPRSSSSAAAPAGRRRRFGPPS